MAAPTGSVPPQTSASSSGGTSTVPGTSTGRGRTPDRLAELKDVGLAQTRTTLMGGMTGTEILFLPGATELVVPFLVTTLTQQAIFHCPGCGVRLHQYYKNSIEPLSREDLNGR